MLLNQNASYKICHKNVLFKVLQLQREELLRIPALRDQYYCAGDFI